MLRNALVFLLLSIATAQGRTWIVDQANGPGTNFLDLVSAEAGVAPGDVLRVRPGRYPGIATSKGLTIIGEGLVRIVDSTQSLPPVVLRVSNLPAGQTFALTRVTLNMESGFGVARGLVVENTLGRVHLDDVTVVNSAFDGFLTVGVDVINAAHFTARGGSGLAGVSVYYSTATFQACPLFGPHSANSLGGRISPNGAGLSAIGSTVQLSRCDLRGGNGGSGSFGTPSYPGAPALVARASRVVITGDATTTAQAGIFLGGGPVPGILADGGQVDLDPDVTVTGAHGGPPTAGTATFVTRQIPSLWTSAAELGMTFTVELDSPPGNLVSIVLGLPIVPIALPFGALAVSPSLLVTLAFGVTQGPTGRVRLPLGVPNAPSLAAAILAVQALDYAPSTGLETSNPAVVVLR